MHYTRSLLFTAIVNGRAFQTVDLTAVPGVSSLTAHTLLTEVGPDLRRFPNAAAFASWLGLCPDNRIKRTDSEYSPAKALKRLSELHSVDIVLPTVEGREIWLRRISKLDEDQQKIFHQLQLQLPERLDPIQIQKCSADSAIA